MADVNRGKRPLSPHLDIYKFEMQMAMSISHRITGVGLTLGAVLVVWWLVAAAIGPGYFAFVDGLMTSWIGNLVLLGSVAALWYHALNGLRHLAWDCGWGLDLPTINRTGKMALGATAALTLLTVVLA
jgi:succinate dehydrogenase / fumarate reductase cytochrome b subunit